MGAEMNKDTSISTVQAAVFAYLIAGAFALVLAAYAAHTGVL